MTAEHLYSLRRTKGCLTDCVAYLFGLHPERVPYFIEPEKGWVQRLSAYFRRRGYRVRWKNCDSVPKRGTFIVVGPSAKYKDGTHAVVYRNGKLVFDPQYPSRWQGVITHRLVVETV